MSHELPPTIDPVAAARWARLPSAPSPWLHEEVGRRMEERLGWIKLQPEAWADWEPLRGGLQAHALLTRRYPRASCYAVEATPARQQALQRALTPAWWRPERWTGTPPQVVPAPPDAGVQMLWANMGLHMAANPQALIQQWHKALAVGGFVMFSCLGPDTLLGLRQLYQDLGWPAPGHAFTDMHDWGDMLVQAGFAEPVMDMEHISLSFDTPARLLTELRELGRNLHPARFPGLRTRAWRSRLEAAMAAHLRPRGDAAGRLTLGFEVSYGHAFKPAPRVRLGEHSAVSLQDMRAMLHAGRAGGP